MSSIKWSDEPKLESEPELRLRRFLAERHGDEEEEDEYLEGTDGERDTVLHIPARAVPIAISLLALAAVGGISWFAYSWSQTTVAQEDLPLITAESTPIKEKPESEGGLVVPYQDQLVLNEVGAEITDEQIEHLLPPPEEPKAFEEVVVEEVTTEEFVAVAPAPEAPANDAQGELGQIQEGAPAAAPIEAVEAEPLVTAAGPEAEVQDPSQAIEAGAIAAEEVPDEIEEVLRNLEANDQASNEQTSAQADTTPTPKAKPIDLASQIQVAEVQNPVPQPQTLTDGQLTAVPTDSGYLLQLSSVKSQSGAQNEWGRLQQSYPGLLGQMNLTVEKAVVDGTTYYRVLTGPFPTRATADDLCAQLKAQNQTCLVKQK
ncbi:MAG: SPOR domain-containing protein [Pseudomonadota bacterium]